uniref:Uncharacterized protein n=1 Tax=Arundo donax TaxID=35708 RepID=A0A0A9FSE2_ARUDO
MKSFWTVCCWLNELVCKILHIYCCYVLLNDLNMLEFGD